MLKKLLKYDLKWIYKAVIVFYILALIFSLIGRSLSEIQNSLVMNIVSQVFKGTAVGMMISILINNLMRVWTRFVRNMYKDESYLTHTLPVNRNTIFLSKVLSAIITMLTSTVVILVCLGICYYSQTNIESLKVIIESTASIYGTSTVELILIVFVVLFLELTFALLSGILGIVIGHKSNNGKMVKSIILGFILFMIPSVLTLIIMYLVGTFNPDIMNLFNTVSSLSVAAIKNVLYGGMLLYIFYIAIYYMIGRKILKSGIDIE